MSGRKEALVVLCLVGVFVWISAENRGVQALGWVGVLGIAWWAGWGLFIAWGLWTEPSQEEVYAALESEQAHWEEGGEEREGDQ